MSNELGPAVKALYAAFRRRGEAPRVRGCPCCTTPAEFDHLASKPLHQLTAEELDRYARKAMTTVGHAEAFRYFLPRIIELAVEGSLLVDREVVFSKIRLGKWHEWPIYEREALERFARALAATFATSTYDEWELDEWVCALGSFVDQWPAILDPLLTGTPAAKENLTTLLAHNDPTQWDGDLPNAFWDEGNPNRALFVEWMRRPDVQAAAV